MIFLFSYSGGNYVFNATDEERQRLWQRIIEKKSELLKKRTFFDFTLANIESTETFLNNEGEEISVSTVPTIEIDELINKL